MTRTTFRPRRRALVAAATALPLTALAACSSDTGEGPSLGGDDGEEGGGTSDGGADTSAYADVIASGPVADDDAVAASEWASAIKERGELIRGGTTANQVFSLIDPGTDEVIGFDAGYCSVLHAMSLTGVSGHFGPRRSAVVIGFGATARGAVTALNAQGIHDIEILTQRGVAAVASPIHGAQIVQLDTEDTELHESEVLSSQGVVPLPQFLAAHDIIVHCTLQDVAAPLTYLRTVDLEILRPGSLIIDVSCDAGMGFEWARPTGFEDPMFTVGRGVDYYAVDHSPSYLWNAATWEISEALLPFLRTVMEGPSAWAESQTISRATEIRSGQILNSSILGFQDREEASPHPPRGGSAPVIR